MFSLRLLTIALTICYSSLQAQDLKPAELISMRTYKLEKIDSFMLEKGFKKQVARQEKDHTIIFYTFRQFTGTSAVQRSLMVSLMPAEHLLDLQYGMWQQTESANFAQQLLQEGYKKIVTSLPDIGGKSASKMVSYKKGEDNISYQEKEQGKVSDKNIILYIFSLSNEKYRP